MNNELRSQFLLDPNVVFLNHGSFGACPRPVFTAYQAWQRELERQPVAFLGRRCADLLAESRGKLARFLGSERDDLVFFPNPTTAINMVARNLGDPTGPASLGPGDEILTTDHEYGAMDRTWRFICQRTGARYVQRPIPLPVTTPDALVERLWTGVNKHTRVIFLSHITSSTALTFPVAEICRRAREAGILTVIDGAHAPGQIPVNLREIGADIYTGTCHKWLCGPKGSAFLYARPQVQDWLSPLVVSWGWESEHPSSSRFVDWHEWQGTRDIAPFLAVPEAIAFQEANDWEDVRQRCRQLAADTRARVNALTGLDPICPDTPEWFTQFCSIRLPDLDDDLLKRRLYDDFRIEVPVIRRHDGCFIRVSFQAYNTGADADALVHALAILLPDLVK